MAKQYYKSGAYENPVAVIDREADMIYADTIRNIGAVTAGIIDKKVAQETERQRAANEQMKWTMDWTLKNQDKYLDQLQKAGNKNPQLTAMFMEQINMMGDLAGRARQASTPEEQRALLNEVGSYKQRLNAGATNVQLMNDAMGVFTEDTQGSLNTEGNLNLNNPKALEWGKKMAITAGMNPGIMTWFVDKDGDWSVRHEGERLESPTETKAALFFGYEPGIIPESTNEMQDILENKIKAINVKTGKVDDQFLMGQMIDGVMAPSVTYVKTSEDGMLQPVYKTNMDMVAQQLAPQAEAVALSYAKDVNTAEAFWDSLPKDIKNNMMKKYSVGEDLQVGNFQMPNGVATKLNQSSTQAIIEGLQLKALTQVPKMRLAGSPIKDPKIKSSKGGSIKGNKLTLQDLLNLSNKSPQQQVAHVESALDSDTQEIAYNPQNNTITVSEKVEITEGEGKDKVTKEEYQDTVYYLNDPSGDSIPGATGDRVEGRNQWLNRMAELYTGGSDASQKLLFDFRNTITGVDPNSGINIKKGFLDKN